jgi:N-acetylmuramoyl-L-alanine amidase
MLLGPAKKGYFSTPSTMPGSLVEPLFITDPFEGSIAASGRGQRVIAAGLARAPISTSGRWPLARRLGIAR